VVATSEFKDAVAVRAVEGKGKGVFALRRFGVGEELGFSTPLLAYSNADTRVFCAASSPSGILLTVLCFVADLRGLQSCVGTAAGLSAVVPRRRGHFLSPR
jgi:hypothetical protein